MKKPTCDAATVFQMAQQLHIASGAPIANAPAQLGPERVAARVRWLREEVSELEIATALVDQVDAVVDVIYVALGALVEMGVDLDGPLQLIHESNLAKAWTDGTFHMTSEGKIIKPPAWKSPREALIRYLNLTPVQPPVKDI